MSPETSPPGQPVIIAVASPPGRGLRGIVRMSGHGSHELLRHLSTDATADSAGRAPCRVALRLDRHELPALAALHAAPRTFTGEDTVELHIAGNPLLLSRVVDALLETALGAGIPARAAEPGEFSARAYLNGRLALDRAESIALAVAAQRDDELHAARLLAEGCVGRAIAPWTAETLELLALVEAGIDFTDEEDVVAIAPTDLAARTAVVASAIDDMLDTALRPERLDAAPTVVLVGAPNAGKSALFNALLGAERAVSTPLAGTTRDSIAAPLRLDGPTGTITVVLVDVAGETVTAGKPDATLDVDALESLSHASARRAAAHADLLLRCVPVDHQAPTLTPVGGPPELIIRTKVDLGSGASAASGRELRVSVVTPCGLDELRRAVVTALTGDRETIAGATMAVTARQDRLLREASDALREATSLADGGGTSPVAPELIAATLRRALDRLGQITGRVVADDILGAIFGRFCIGK